VNLHAVWGTADDDVWVAGAGRTLAHWNGERWIDERSRLPLASNAPLLAEESVVLGQARTLDGGLWFAAQPQPLQAASDGSLILVTPPRPGGTNVDLPVAVAARGQSAWILTGKGEVYRPGQSGVEMQLSTIAGTYAATAFLPTTDGCFLLAVSRYSPTSEVVIARCDGGVTPVAYEDGGAYPQPIRAMATAEGGYVAGGGMSDIFASTDGVVWTRRSAASEVTPDHSTNHILSFSDGGRWFLGQEGQIFDLDGALVRAPSGRDLLAAWISPQGTVWAVGEAGTVIFKEAGASDWTSVGLGEVGLLGSLFVDESHQVAAGRGGVVLKRNASGGWESIVPNGMVTEDVMVSAWASPSGRVALGAASGRFWYDARGGVRNSPAFSADVYVWGADEGAIFLGNGMKIWTSDSAGATIPLLDLISGTITGIHGRSRDQIFTAHDLGVSESALVRGRISDLTLGGDSGVWNSTLVDLPQPPTDVSVTSHSVWVSGRRSMIGFVDGSLDGGAFQSEWSGQPDNLVFTSVWASEDGGVWVLTDHGAVLRRTGPKTWVRERPGYGVTRGAEGLLRIRGNSTDLYLVGAGGAVLRRSR
jgi:hypothetical protein